MRRYNTLGLAALSMAALGVGYAVTTEEAEPAPPVPPREPETVHKHAREIARRLRQQARAGAKKAAKARGEAG